MPRVPRLPDFMKYFQGDCAGVKLVALALNVVLYVAVAATLAAPPIVIAVLWRGM